MPPGIHSRILIFCRISEQAAKDSLAGIREHLQAQPSE
jgi:hypothetical protein